MTFKTAFQHSIQYSLGSGNLPEPSFTAPPNLDDNQLLTVLAHWSCHCQADFRMQNKMLDAFCLLVTKNGSCTLHHPRETCRISRGQAVLLDCRYSFTIHAAGQDCWSFQLIFFQGAAADTYYHLAIRNGSLLCPAPSTISLESLLTKLIPLNEFPITDLLAGASLLTEVLTQLTLSKLSSLGTPANAAPPAWLAEIKQRFDHNYQSAYSLKEFEDEFGINKYRIIREFEKHFGSSPMYYLSNIRMNNAKHLLRHTDLKINTIGSMVGLDNTTHFINLFKKETGLTPLMFRKQTPV